MDDLDGSFIVVGILVFFSSWGDCWCIYLLGLNTVYIRTVCPTLVSGDVAVRGAYLVGVSLWKYSDVDCLPCTGTMLETLVWKFVAI